MGNDRFWRFFRSLVCFLLICCILINCSPIKAKAVAISSALAIGLVAVLLAGAAGVAFHPETAEQVVAIGENMTQHLRDWGKVNGKSSDVEVWIAGIQIYDYVYNGGDDNPDGPRDYKVPLAQGLLAGVSAWCASLILGLNEVKTGSSAIESYMFYNGVLLPDITALTGTYKYNCITFDYAQNKYKYFGTNQLPIAKYNSNFGGRYGLTVTGFCRYFYNAENQEWELSDSMGNGKIYPTIGANAEQYNLDVYLWSDYDLIADDGTQLFYASEPSAETSVVIDPIYVGDIPQKVQNGEIEEEKIPLPSLMDYSQLFQNTGASTAQEAVQQTMQQLSTGQMTHADYMNAIQSKRISKKGS